jgi:hypothetical protein
MNTRCSICTSDKAGTINSFLAAGRSANWIEGEMRRLGQPTKGETVRRHHVKCLNEDAKGTITRSAIKTGGAGMNPTDFAEAVRAEAARLLADGDLKIRAEHGLSAQALIDRRAEKQADRQMMVEMARLLSGSGPMIEPPDDIIAGEWREVDEPEGLAPLALVGE